MSCVSNAGIASSPTLVYAVVNNALIYSSLHINQTLHKVLHILRFFVDWLPQIL